MTRPSSESPQSLLCAGARRCGLLLALVYGTYLRLVASPGREGWEPAPHWGTLTHFFVAAAEAMRRVLICLARLRDLSRC
jgi:hypothetical protein